MCLRGVWWVVGMVVVVARYGTGCTLHHQYSTAPHYTTPTQVTTTTTAVMFPALLYTAAELSAAFLYTIAAPFPSLMFPAAFTLAHSAELSVTFHLSSNLLHPAVLSTQ